MAPATIPSINDVEAMVVGQRKEWEKLLDELRPHVEAFHRIEAMVANFDRVVSDSPAPVAPVKRGPRKGGTRKGGRAAEFLAVVTAHPGITVTEAVEYMDGINANYLYRLARDANEAGHVRKDGQKYYVIEQPAAEDEAKPE